MVKQLKKMGNSHAIVLDKPLMELIGLQPGGNVNIEVRGTTLCLTPTAPRFATQEQVDVALRKVMQTRKSLLKRLAQ